MSDLTAAELDALLTEGETRLAQIVANREVVEGVHEKVDAHPWWFWRNLGLLRRSSALLDENFRLLALNDALLARLRLARGKARAGNGNGAHS